MKAWKLLVNSVALVHTDPQYYALIVADLNAEQLRTLGRQQSLRDVIEVGHTLSLASPEEYKARVDRIVQHLNGFAQRQNDAFHAEYRLTRGDGKVATDKGACRGFPPPTLTALSRHRAVPYP